MSQLNPTSLSKGVEDDRAQAHVNRVTTMGELTASLAHEIKQPISAAITDADTCLRWLGRDVPDRVQVMGVPARVTRSRALITAPGRA